MTMAAVQVEIGLAIQHSRFCHDSKWHHISAILNRREDKLATI